MIDTEQKRGRGRPIGSTLPAEQRRKRKDYRLSPTALSQIEQWKQEKKETAFIEEAIAHYVAFLSGQSIASEEAEQQQSRVNELERDLQMARDEITALKSSKQVVLSSPPVKESPQRHAVSYQIIVKHAPGPCPLLPDGFSYDHSAPYQHPTHQVFSQNVSIDKARREVERLKQVTGIQEVWLAKNGYAMDREKWARNRDRWEKN